MECSLDGPIQNVSFFGVNQKTKMVAITGYNFNIGGNGGGDEFSQILKTFPNG